MNKLKVYFKPVSTYLGFPFRSRRPALPYFIFIKALTQDHWITKLFLMNCVRTWYDRQFSYKSDLMEFKLLLDDVHFLEIRLIPRNYTPDTDTDWLQIKCHFIIWSCLIMIYGSVVDWQKTRLVERVWTGIWLPTGNRQTFYKCLPFIPMAPTYE